MPQTLTWRMEQEQPCTFSEQVTAPVKRGKLAGKMEYYAGKEQIGSVNILYDQSVPRSTWIWSLGKLVRKLAFH